MATIVTVDAKSHNSVVAHHNEGNEIHLSLSSEQLIDNRKMTFFMQLY